MTHTILDIIESLLKNKPDCDTAAYLFTKMVISGEKITGISINTDSYHMYINENKVSFQVVQQGEGEEE